MKGKHIKVASARAAVMRHKVICIIMAIALLTLMIPHGLIAHAENYNYNPPVPQDQPGLPDPGFNVDPDPSLNEAPQTNSVPQEKADETTTITGTFLDELDASVPDGTEVTFTDASGNDHTGQVSNGIYTINDCTRGLGGSIFSMPDGYCTVYQKITDEDMSKEVYNLNLKTAKLCYITGDVKGKDGESISDGYVEFETEDITYTGKIKDSKLDIWVGMHTFGFLHIMVDGYKDMWIASPAGGYTGTTTLDPIELDPSTGGITITTDSEDNELDVYFTNVKTWEVIKDTAKVGDEANDPFYDMAKVHGGQFTMYDGSFSYWYSDNPLGDASDYYVMGNFDDQQVIDHWELTDDEGPVHTFTPDRSDTIHLLDNVHYTIKAVFKEAVKDSLTIHYEGEDASMTYSDDEGKTWKPLAQDASFDLEEGCYFYNGIDADFSSEWLDIYDSEDNVLYKIKAYAQEGHMAVYWWPWAFDVPHKIVGSALVTAYFDEIPGPSTTIKGTFKDNEGGNIPEWTIVYFTDKNGNQSVGLVDDNGNYSIEGCEYGVGGTIASSPYNYFPVQEDVTDEDMQTHTFTKDLVAEKAASLSWAVKNEKGQEVYNGSAWYQVGDTKYEGTFNYGYVNVTVPLNTEGVLHVTADDYREAKVNSPEGGYSEGGYQGEITLKAIADTIVVKFGVSEKGEGSGSFNNLTIGEPVTELILDKGSYYLLNQYIPKNIEFYDPTSEDFICSVGPVPESGSKFSKWDNLTVGQKVKIDSDLNANAIFNLSTTITGTFKDDTDASMPQWTQVYFTDKNGNEYSGDVDANGNYKIEDCDRGVGGTITSTPYGYFSVHETVSDEEMKTPTLTKNLVATKGALLYGDVEDKQGKQIFEDGSVWYQVGDKKYEGLYSYSTVNVTVPLNTDGVLHVKVNGYHEKTVDSPKGGYSESAWLGTIVLEAMPVHKNYLTIHY